VRRKEKAKYHEEEKENELFMSAYFIARVNVSDREQYKQYIKVVPGIIAKYEGKVLVRTEESITLEGQEEHRRIVIIEFPAAEKAKEFYNSQEYRQAKELRRNAAVGEIIVVEGVAGPGELC
jgi:uncharacterized protein (DUF1330 family)